MLYYAFENEERVHNFHENKDKTYFEDSYSLIEMSLLWPFLPI